jgi:hypothetical protein
MTLDAFAFDTDAPGINASHGRYYSDLTGAGALSPPDRLSASLPIPTGSVIYQINVAYQGEPILEIWKRSLASPASFAPSFQQSLPSGSGARTASYDLSSPITVDPNTTMAVRCYTFPGATVYGVTVGYTPPTQAFLPFSGPTPRVLDTRSSGGKLNPSEERIVSLGLAGVRGAVINLTVTNTGAGGGYVAVFPANIGWPGNSSINWTNANENIANGVITATDASSQIKIRGGATPTDVVIDRIGWLI